MKRISGGAIWPLGIIALVLLTLAAPPASATEISFFLRDNNGGTLSGFPSPYAEVEIDLNSPTVAGVFFGGFDSVTTQCPGSFCSYRLGGESTVALNVNATNFSVGPVTEGPHGSFKQINIDTNPAPPNQTVDGFGSFNLTIDNNDGFTNATGGVFLKLTNLSGTWASPSDVLVANDHNKVAAAHIFISSPGCTGACVAGFAANPIPEPTTLLLLGSGLAGLGWFGWKRIKGNPEA